MKKVTKAHLFLFLFIFTCICIVFGQNRYYKYSFKEEYYRGFNEALDENNIDEMCEESYNRGYLDGLDLNSAYNEGYDTGYDIGYDSGYSEGSKNIEAYQLGYSDGYDEAYYQGYDSGYEKGKSSSFVPNTLKDFSFVLIGIIGGSCFIWLITGVIADSVLDKKKK